MRRVVITSIGALTTPGKNLDEYWEGLNNGVNGSSLSTRFDTEKFKTKFASEVKGYDSGNYFDRKEDNKLDMYSQFVHTKAAGSFQFEYDRTLCRGDAKGKRSDC